MEAESAEALSSSSAFCRLASSTKSSQEHVDHFCSSLCRASQTSGMRPATHPSSHHVVVVLQDVVSAAYLTAQLINHSRPR
jgi:hypothetical protein